MFYPCIKVNAYLESLVADYPSDDELLSQKYSSGDSEGEDQIVIKTLKPFTEMDADEKDDHSFFLWQKLAKKLHGAIYLMQAFNFLHSRMYLQGTTRRLAFMDNRDKKKPHWFIIMPRSKLYNIIAACSHALLIYTALFVPF